MLKHVVPAHRSSSSLNNSSLSTPPSSFCYSPQRRSSLTAVESKSSPSPCGRCIYRRAASCGTTSPPLSHQNSPIYEGQRGKCDLIREEAPAPGKFPQVEENNNVVDNGFPPTGLHGTPRRCSSRSQGPDSSRSFVDMVNRNDSVPRSIHEFDLDYQVNSCQVPDSQERDCRCHISNSSIPYSCAEDETTSLVTLDEALRQERSPFQSPTSDTYSYGSPSPFPYNPSLLSKSCTLPRREIMMHNEEIRRSSFRSNASTCSLLSSVSCSSLSSVRNLNSRSTSTSSLLETVPVKIYLRRLRSDMEYKTVSLSLQTTCKELVVILLRKFRLRHRDPNLFFILMEVTVRSPSDGAPVKRQLVLEDNARPAELQQCRPKGEANFSIGVRRGGLIRVHDSILMQGSQYKSLMVAYHTTADELVQLVLKCYNSSENPLNYALHEVCKNPYGDRPLTPDECPLKTQWEWPRNQRNNWAFFLRRNLTYAFSLKSRMMNRNIESPSRADVDAFEEESLGASLHSSPDSRTSSVSSSSSVSRICHSSSPDSRSSVSSTTSVSSGTSSSEKSVDSGFGSPFSSIRVSEQTKKSLQIPSGNCIESPTSSPAKEKSQPSGKIPLKDLPPKPKLDSLQKSTCSSFQNSPEKKVAQKPVIVLPKPLVSNAKGESLPPSSSPAKVLSTAPNPKSTESSQNTPRSVIPITASVSRMSLNSSLPSVTGMPIPASTSTPTSRALPPKPRQRTIITITSTTRSPPRGQIELQHRHLRPVIPPPSLKIKSNVNRVPESTNADHCPKDSPKPIDTSTPEQKVSSSLNNKASSSKAEQDLRDTIESLRNLSDRRPSHKISRQENPHPHPHPHPEATLKPGK